MSKYSIKEYNIPGMPVEPRAMVSPEEIKIREEQRRYLRSLGVYTAIYTDSFVKLPVHPDGIHTYLQDSSLAQELLERNKELPQDLLDRLAYYKPIVDELLQIKE